jgi:hypothetical protein
MFVRKKKKGDSGGSKKKAPPKKAPAAASSSTPAKTNKKKTPPAGAEDPSSADKCKLRGVNFADEEDLLICNAYVNKTLDSKKGNQQTGTTFWNGIFDSFQTLRDEIKESK